MNRDETIHALAASVGMTDIYGTQHISRYDATTGTLYCEGIVLPNNSVDKIMHWYKQQADQYRPLASRDSSIKEQYLRYLLAYQAIKLMKDSGGLS